MSSLAGTSPSSRLGGIYSVFLVFIEIITKLLIIALFKQGPTPGTRSGLEAPGYVPMFTIRQWQEIRVQKVYSFPNAVTHHITSHHTTSASVVRSQADRQTSLTGIPVAKWIASRKRHPPGAPYLAPGLCSWIHACVYGKGMYLKGAVESYPETQHGSCTCL